MQKRRVFVDMDGVLVDFEAYANRHGLTPDETKRKPGAYLAMEPMPGAIEGIRKLMEMDVEVWIATKPPTGVALAYSDKVYWILNHLPELKRNIIITHDKGLLGDEQDFLVDDRPHKANCESFKGTIIRYINGLTWNDVLGILTSKLALNVKITENQ